MVKNGERAERKIDPSNHDQLKKLNYDPSTPVPQDWTLVQSMRLWL